MKQFDLTFSISFSGGKGVEEAAENRNYLSSRMSEEVGEMVRVLQLTTYDEDEWDSDNLVFFAIFLSLIFWLCSVWNPVSGIGIIIIRPLTFTLNLSERAP